MLKDYSSFVEPIIEVNNTGLLPVVISLKINLDCTGYLRICFEVIGTKLGEIVTSIIPVHNNCTCT